MKPADDRFNQRLRARLLCHEAAIAALQTQLGIGRALAERFRLGLSEPYPKTATSPGQAIHQDVLVAPVMGQDGRFCSRYIYRHLDSITTDNRIAPPNTWSAGASESYFSRKADAGDSLIVVDDAGELWALAALMEGTSLEKTHVIVAPSKAREWPSVWKSKEFWAPWKRVNVAVGSTTAGVSDQAPNLDQRARDLARQMGRDVHRVHPYQAATWLASRLDGVRHNVFQRLLKDAVLLKPEDLVADEAAKYTSAVGEDLSCAYARGYLFEAVRVLVTEDVEGQVTERFKTVVVRSDRTIHRVEEMPAPPGTPKSEKVFRLLPDGALLRRVPTPSTDSTWRWPSIDAYVHRRATSPPLIQLLEQVIKHLKAAVWLPFERDYQLLACVVAATYCQQVFDAVPLVLVNGPSRSGKTELTNAISSLSCNSPGPQGVISAATLTRLVDASHGFVALDDLERIVSRRGSEPQFSELAQALKVCYKKASAHRMVTDTNKGNELQRLNLFGIKLFNNTVGVDDILGSRALKISTRPMPAGESLAREGRMDAEQCAKTRDDFHVWAFTHVAEIARTYTEVFPNVSTRDEEIFAPIRVIAQLSGSETLRALVKESLGTARDDESFSPVDALEQALVAIVRSSITAGTGVRTVVTVLESQMRLQLQEGQRSWKSRTTDISEIESPEWLGRQFKHSFAPPGAKATRVEMFGRGTRAYPLSDEVITRGAAAAGVTRESVPDNPDPRAFCIACHGCSYQAICEMRAQKVKAEQRRRTSPIGTAGSLENASPGHASLN